MLLVLVLVIFLIVNFPILYIHVESPWKMLITYILSAIPKHPPITTVLGLSSSLEVKNLSKVNKEQAYEIYVSHKSHHKVYAEEVFSPRWVAIRDEKERMLMDCVERSRDGPTRWIPKDIPNIGGRIEPLLHLEILFPAQSREFPSRLFGEHNLDFSRKLSNILSITLSAIDDVHIQKPKEQNQVVMDALADNDVHHPLVWEKLLDHYVDKEKLFCDAGDGFTIEMCLNLVTSIYLPQDSPPESYSCLLAFFPTSESYNDLVDPNNLEYSEFKDHFWTGSTYALACMASLMGGGPEYCVIEPNAEWVMKPLFLNILQAMHHERVADVPSQTPFPVYPDLPQHIDSAISAVGILLDQAFKQGIPSAYEAFQEKGSLHYIAEKSRLHLGLIEGLRAYITGLSDAKAGKFPDIQSDEFPDRHIHDLHEAPVICCICASITYSGYPPRPILSSLASIDPNHSQWTEILDTLNSPDHEYSVNNYSFDPIKAISSDDQKHLKKRMKKTLHILDECLKAERARRNGINWLSKIFNYHTSSAGNERVQDQRDIELASLA
ncbi:hypothetical protein EDD85DRAFT_795126 [Armillaria nabsnona]|nr:hypothetical protein EDD85DRAFT_795126 [Armillaria nabsnona]